MGKIKYCHQINETECGLCCVVMLLSYFGSYISLNYLRDEISVGRDGINLLQISDLLYDEGIRSTIIGKDNFLFCKTPMVALDENSNHFSLIKQTARQNYIIYDPEIGKYKLKFSEVIEKFSYFLVPSLEEKFVPRKIKENYWRHFFVPIRKSKFQFFKLFIFSMIVYLLTLSVTFMIQILIDALSGGKSADQFYLFIALLVAAAYLISSHIRNQIFIKLELIFDKDLNTSLFTKVLELPFTFFNSRGENEILYRLGLLGSIRSLISNGLVNVILDGGTVLFLLIYIFILNYYYGLVVVVLSIITFIYILNINRKILAINQSVLSKQSELLRIQIELVKTLEYLKVTGCEKQIFKKFCNELKSFLGYYKKSEKLSFFNSLVLNFLGLMAPFLLLYTSVFAGLLASNTIGEKMTLYFIASMVISKETSLFQNVTNFELIKNILERVNDIYDTNSEITNTNSVPMLEIKEMEFKDVSFKYSDNSDEVLSNIDFKIKKGQKIAFVGETGSGKSTILKLLSRLYNPTKGKILINGSDLNSINISSFRQLISYIPQNIDLMDDTIYNNLVLGRQYDEDELKNCLECARLYQDVKLLPLGLNTKISNMSNNLSGGQKQRISIARAMLYKGEVLMSDEGTSSLDFLTENEIMKSLDKLFDTQIMVAHRLTTIKNSDMIYFLDNGKIIESGTHDELMNIRGAYYKLYLAQENSVDA